MKFYRPSSITNFISPILLAILFLIIFLSRGWIWNAFGLLGGLIIILLVLSVLGSYWKIENGKLIIVEYFRSHTADISQIEKVKQNYKHTFTKNASVRIPYFQIFLKNQKQQAFSFNTRPYSEKQIANLLHDLQNANRDIIIEQTLVTI